MRASTAGLGEMLLGWRSLFLGICGALAGFIGAITNKGLTARLTLIAIGCVSVVLLMVSWRYMKHQRDEEQAWQQNP